MRRFSQINGFEARRSKGTWKSLDLYLFDKNEF
ncbi:hypothetical protein PDE_09069 [Penicillium oxalicum 114-2]|uniref:Uncharacterized protein n=1 Tax=Penicillium oxalicum (strain 114-2 / CGMCC 5302) TaxID=933388 RepID=S8BG62_PENO1|nr:hypothetical protein PDE_09069 [Penicillium oxalicum 114-2]